MIIEALIWGVGSTILNQTRGDKWLLSDAMDKFINVYLDFCHGNITVFPKITEQCEQIIIEHESFHDDIEFVTNLEQLSLKCAEQFEKS